MLKKVKFLSMFMILAAVSIILAACGTGESESDTSSGSTGSEGGEEIKKLVVGTEATYAPFEYMDDKGNVVGLDVDILNAITEATGIEFEIRNVGWEPVFQQVTNGQIDMGVSAITITDERKETYDFTDPYYEATQLIVVNEGSDIKSLADLKDKKIAVQINTTGHMAAQDLQGQTSANIKAYENLPIAIQQVVNGTADAAIGDNAAVLEYIKNNPEQTLVSIEDDSFEKEYYGFMVKKGNTEVLELLNDGIQKIKDNGKLAEITGQEIE